MNGYKAFYNGKSKDVYAESSLQARDKAVELFNVAKSKQHMVSVVLAEIDGKPVEAVIS